MNSRQAIKALKEKGYIGRKGKSSHYILKKDDLVIIIPMGRMELSSGMTAKVRSHLQK